MSELKDGATSVRLGAAVLRPMQEQGHFGLFRPIVLVRRDGSEITREQHEQELGPLAIYRRMGKGDVAPPDAGSVPGSMRTHDPVTNQPLTLMLVWRPTADEMKETFR